MKQKKIDHGHFCFAALHRSCYNAAVNGGKHTRPCHVHQLLWYHREVSYPFFRALVKSWQRGYNPNSARHPTRHCWCIILRANRCTCDAIATPAAVAAIFHADRGRAHPHRVLTQPLSEHATLLPTLDLRGHPPLPPRQGLCSKQAGQINNVTAKIHAFFQKDPRLRISVRQAQPLCS